MALSKGEKLNKRVWQLFEKAGFQTRPSSVDSEEYKVNVPAGHGRPVDLYAEIPSLGITLIGSNKSGKKAGNTQSWTAHLADCEQLRTAAGAQKCLLVVTDHELPDPDIAHAKKLGIPVWGKDQLEYYEAVVAAIGTYAQYEILAALGITTKDQGEFLKVLAIKILQPTNTGTVEMYMFTISPERLLRTSVIYRKAQGNAETYQRMLKKDRLPKIAKFVEKTDALLPTDIILHLNDDVATEVFEPGEIYGTDGKTILKIHPSNYSMAVVSIPMRYGSLEIIDGQHRLFGFVGAPKSTQSNFNLVVVGIKNLTPKQKGATFVAINDNSRRMDPNLVAYLKYTNDDALCKTDPGLMAIRLVVDMNKRAPFKGKIRLIDIGTQHLTLKGLSGYSLRALVGARGRLRKLNPNNTVSEYLRMLGMYFGILQTVFKVEWENPDEYIVATNRGFSAFLKLLNSILKIEENWPTDTHINEYMRALKKNFAEWKTQELRGRYVGSGGWRAFHEDMVLAISKDKKFRKFKP